MRVLSASSYATTPWKNGGGVTREIARSDDDSPPGWRLSVAVIDRDGAFSDFSGCDRTIVPIDGAGFTLAVDGARECLDRLYQPFRFAGEAKVECSLLDGSSRDFNVITRRDAWTHQVRHLVVPPLGTTILLTGNAFAYAADAITVRGADDEYALEPGDTLEAPGPATLDLDSGGTPANVLIVMLRRS